MLCLFSFTSLYAQSSGIESEDGFNLIQINDDGDSFYIKTDKTTKSPFENKIYSAKYWIKIVKGDNKIKDKNGTYKKIPGEIILQYYSCSCVDKTFVLEENHKYNNKGKLLKCSVYGDEIKQSSRVIPGSISETILKAACVIID